jgi:ubiquinol-cytochrome c reductase cytochrome b subunit
VLLVSVLAATAATPTHALSKERHEAGEALFHKTGCEYCHGVHGMGSEKAPDLSAVGKRKKREQIEQQILKGGNGMPAFGEVLPADDVKVLVDYLSSRKKAGR